VRSHVDFSIELLFLDFENNCVKRNTVRPILQQQLSYSLWNLVFGNIKFIGYSQWFSRKETSNDSGVARHGEVYSLCA